MKKILIFSTAYFPLVGGAEIAVKEITDRVPDVEWDLITAKIKKNLESCEKIGRVNVYRIGFGCSIDKFLLPILGLYKAIILNKKRNYNACWSIMASHASVAASFFKVFNPDKKLILTLQEGDEEEHLKRYVFGIDFLYKILIKPWHTLVFKKADAVTAISNYLKERAIKNGVKVPIEIIPNGVDTNRFKVSARGGSQPKADQPLAGATIFGGKKLKVDELKSRLRIKPEEKVIITVSRLVEKNGISDLIDAVDMLKTKNYQLKIKLLILGGGPLEKSLKFKVSAQGGSQPKADQPLAGATIFGGKNLEDRVLFLGEIPHEKIPEYLALADVFVRPSLSEGFGNSFVEAMAMGIPVVGTKVGGIPDFLRDPSAGSGQATGLFCEVKNPKDIAEKIKWIIEDKTLREKIINNAQKMVKEKYEWNTICKSMQVKIFDRI